MAGFAVLGIVVYVFSNPERQNIYDHFVWQADAFLQGRAWIPWPLSSGEFQNGYFQDVYPIGDGRALVPFPPLPAIVLLPAVAAFGLATNAALVAAVLGGLNVGLAYRMVWRLTTAPLVAILATLFYGFGTVAWYAAMLGSTWFFAHVVASTFLLLAITTALDADRRTAAQGTSAALVDRRQVLAGLSLGLAATARLTTVLAAPFFALVGGGGSVVRRALSAGIGAAIPVLLLLAYNAATSGQLFQPGYEHLYQTEFTPVPDGLLTQIFPALQGITYHPGEWALQDPRYIPQNLVIMLAWLPEVRPECGLALLDQACPLLRPDKLGMSLLLTSPGLAAGDPGGGQGVAAADRPRLRPCHRDRERREPDALQPGLGPVRLPLQQRRGAVRAAPRDPWAGALWGALVDGRPGRHLDRHQRLGGLLGRRAGLVAHRRDAWPPASMGGAPLAPSLALRSRRSRGP